MRGEAAPTFLPRQSCSKPFPLAPALCSLQGADPSVWGFAGSRTDGIIRIKELRAQQTLRFFFFFKRGSFTDPIYGAALELQWEWGTERGREDEGPGILMLQLGKMLFYPQLSALLVRFQPKLILTQSTGHRYEGCEVFFPCEWV